MKQLPFTNGHVIDGIPHKFPHACPGEGCAIQSWLLWQVRATKYRMAWMDATRRIPEAEVTAEAIPDHVTLDRGGVEQP